MVSPLANGLSQVYTVDQVNGMVDDFARNTTTGVLSPTPGVPGFVNTGELTPLSQPGLFQDDYGQAIAVQGNWAVIGSEGFAYVYQLTGTHWNYVTTLTSPDITVSDPNNGEFGEAVAVYAPTGANPTVFVGAPSGMSSDAEIDGAVFVFQLDQSGHVSKTAKIVSQHPTANANILWSSRFGSAIAVTAGSNGFATVVIGAPTWSDPDVPESQETGAAFIWSGKGDAWSEVTWFQANPASPFAYSYGAAVAIAGNTVVVGAQSSIYTGFGDNPAQPGGAYVYQNRGGVWRPEAVFTEGAIGQRFGTAVAVVDPSSDLTASSATIFVDMPAGDGIGTDGTVFIFHEANGAWSTTPADTIAGPGGHAGAYGFGDSLSIVGGQLLVGSPEEYHVLPDGSDASENWGAVRLYQNSDPNWQSISPRLVAVLETPDDQQYGASGQVVGFNGSTIFDGAEFANGNGNGLPVEGAVYLFQSSLIGGGDMTFDSAANPTNLYVASPATSSISVFQRDPTTGALTLVQSYFNGERRDALIQSTRNNQAGQVTNSPTLPPLDGFQSADVVVVSPDDSTVFVAGADEAGIAMFQRDATTGILTFVSEIVSPVKAITGLAIDSTGTELYLVSSSEHNVFVLKNTAGVWSSAPSLMDPHNSIPGLDRVAAVTLSSDGTNIYVACAGSSSIAIFARNTTTGQLAYQSSVTNGQGGVEGLGGVTAIAESPDGNLVFAAGSSENSLAVFDRNSSTGALTFVQSVVNHSGGVSGLADPNSLTVSPEDAALYVGSSGLNGDPAGIASFLITETPPPPLQFNVTYGSGIGSVTLTTGSGSDTIALGSMSALTSVTIHAGAGSDSVVDSDVTSHQNVTVDLGSGGDTFDLRGSGNSSTVNVSAAGVNNLFQVWTTGSASTINLAGGPGANIFRVVGTSLASDVNISGYNSASATGNILELDSQGRPTNPVLPNNPFFLSPSPGKGTISVPGTGSKAVNYQALEEVETITPPILNAVGPFSVALGSSVTLTATPLTLTQGPGTYGWDLNNDGNFSDAAGSSVTLSWAQLSQLGINAVGTYTVWVKLTDTAGNITEAPATLQVTDIAPSDPIITNSGPVTVGNPVTISASATDSAGSADSLTYTFVFDDGTASYSNSSGITTHTFSSVGKHVVQVNVTDAFGGSNPDVTSTTVAVTVVVPTTISVAGPAAVAAGTPYSLTMAAFGPLTAAISSWTVNWGDGTIQNYIGNPASESHVYAVAGNFSIVAQATEPQGVLTSNIVSVEASALPIVAPRSTLSGPSSISDSVPYNLTLTVKPSKAQ